MIQANLIPMVVDKSSTGERAFDIYSLLLKERIIFLDGHIDQKTASIVVAQLLYLNSIDPKQQINLYIQSPGGSIYAGFAIYDTIKMIEASVSTFSVGFSGSMGTFLLTSGNKGNRYALPHSTIHMHPAAGGSQGYTEDVRISTREQERLQVQLFHIMGKCTGHDWQEIEKFFVRDKFLNAVEAKEYGLVDEIIGDPSNLISLEKSKLKVNYMNN